MSKNTVNLNESDQVVAKAIDAVGEAEDNLIRLSTGVVLEAHAANPHILIRVMTAKPRPEPPMVFMKSMGRQMENPDDPDYISRVKNWEMSYNNGMLNALVGLGTEIKSIPKGMEGPHPKIKAFVICSHCSTKNPAVEQTSCKKCGAPLPPPEAERLAWIEEYKTYGLPTLEDSYSWRKIAWVLFKAAVNEKDTALIGEKVKNLSGVKEADVKSAETFSGSDEESR